MQYVLRLHGPGRWVLQTQKDTSTRRWVDFAFSGFLLCVWSARSGVSGAVSWGPIWARGSLLVWPASVVRLGGVFVWGSRVDSRLGAVWNLSPPRLCFAARRGVCVVCEGRRRVVWRPVGAWVCRRVFRCRDVCRLPCLGLRSARCCVPRAECPGSVWSRDYGDPLGAPIEIGGCGGKCAPISVLGSDVCPRSGSRN